MQTPISSKKNHCQSRLMQLTTCQVQGAAAECWIHPQPCAEEGLQILRCGCITVHVVARLATIGESSPTGAVHIQDVGNSIPCVLICCQLDRIRHHVSHIIVHRCEGERTIDICNNCQTACWRQALIGVIGAAKALAMTAFQELCPLSAVCAYVRQAAPCGSKSAGSQKVALLGCHQCNHQQLGVSGHDRDVQMNPGMQTATDRTAGRASGTLGADAVLGHILLHRPRMLPFLYAGCAAGISTACTACLCKRLRDGGLVADCVKSMTG